MTPTSYPRADDAERALLAHILHDPALVMPMCVAARLNHRAFALYSCCIMYSCMEHLWNKQPRIPPTMAAVRANLATMPGGRGMTYLTAVGQRALDYLEACDNPALDPMHCIRAVREAWDARVAMHVALKRRKRRAPLDASATL